MRSVVIHIKKKPQEWHLVESLFYKVQASKQLIFLEIGQNDYYENWEQLYRQVLSYILQNRFDHWQLILLNNNELTSQNRTSLARELHLVKEKLLNPLSEKGVIPSRRILLTLDGLKRKADNSPVDVRNHLFWQIDNFGYINDTHVENNKNLFLEDEILSIDQGWGALVNLKDAGLMEDPNKIFMEDLQKRKILVKGILRKLILEKKKNTEEILSESKSCHNYLLTSEMLTTIHVEFCEQLDIMCNPPFSYNLSTFLPSNLLKTILKENIGVSSVISDFLLIRKTNSEYSPFQKIRALLEYAFLLNAIVLKPEVIDRVGNGFSYEVEMVLREEEIKQMYANYYTCLQVAKEKIENRNLGQEHFMTKKFAEINALPYSAEPLDDNGKASPTFTSKTNRNFLHEWNLYLGDVEIELKARADLSLESAKEGIKVLAVTKRQKQDHFLQETVNMNEYSENLIKTKNQIQSELDDVAPSLTKVVEKWKKTYPALKQRMVSLLKSLPSQNIMITAFMIAFFSILIPYLSSSIQINSPNNVTSILRYMIIPSLLLCVILFLCFITYRNLIKPITMLTLETSSIQKSLANEQILAHSKYNDYLNKIYKLFRIRNQYREIEEKASQQKEINILYRWHQGEINNHISILNQLMDSLQIGVQLDNKEKCISFFNTSFNVKSNVDKNPIYSPLDCQFENVQTGHSLEVYVVNSRDEIITWTLKPIEKIRFSQDKVYSL
jgi:hypothetical protein